VFASANSVTSIGKMGMRQSRNVNDVDLWVVGKVCIVVVVTLDAEAIGKRLALARRLLFGSMISGAGMSAAVKSRGASENMAMGQ
jgi:hypothetical protein